MTAKEFQAAMENEPELSIILGLVAATVTHQIAEIENLKKQVARLEESYKLNK